MDVGATCNGGGSRNCHDNAVLGVFLHLLLLLLLLLLWWWWWWDRVTALTAAGGGGGWAVEAADPRGGGGEESCRVAARHEGGNCRRQANHVPKEDGDDLVVRAQLGVRAVQHDDHLGVPASERGETATHSRPEAGVVHLVQLEGVTPVEPGDPGWGGIIVLVVLVRLPRRGGRRRRRHRRRGGADETHQ